MDLLTNTVVCTAVGSTPSTFDTPVAKASATPGRAEKTTDDDTLHSADDAQPTHNPEPETAASMCTALQCT